MQKKLIALLLTTAGWFGPAVVAATYCTEATMSLQKEEGTVEVIVRVSRLQEQDGKLVEELVAQPTLHSAPGVPANLHTGLGPTDPDYAVKENVTVDVSWPYPNESGTAFCAVTVKRGNDLVSRSKLQVKVEGPGRVPLMVAAQDIDPQSVLIDDEKNHSCVLFKFAAKTQEAVKKLAIENYGNEVQIRDLQGRLSGKGHSFGTYREIGMSLLYNTRSEAEEVASLLRRKDSK